MAWQEREVNDGVFVQPAPRWDWVDSRPGRRRSERREHTSWGGRNASERGQHHLPPRKRKRYDHGVLPGGNHILEPRIEISNNVSGRLQAPSSLLQGRRDDGIRLYENEVEDEDDDKLRRDDEGHYQGICGNVLSDRYEILGEAGLGTFGRVVNCFDRRRSERVAIKIVRRISRYTESAVVEARIVRDVNRRAEIMLEAPEEHYYPDEEKKEAVDHRRVDASGSFSLLPIRGQYAGDTYNRRAHDHTRTHQLLVSKDESLSEYSDPRKLIVQLHSTFYEQGHYCIVFEKLGASLYDILKLNDYRPFLPRTAARFSYQILQALDFLHGIGLIHTDLKLENLLLRHSDLITIDDSSSAIESCFQDCAEDYENNQETLGTGTRPCLATRNLRRSRENKYYAEKETIRKRGQKHEIKKLLKIPAHDNIVIIDFGGATYDHERKSSIVNTRQYRAPEVILSVGWSTPSDLWSAGCIVAELFRGDLLFATHSNTCHIGLIDRLVGPFPSIMLQRSKYCTRYFDHHGRSNWATALKRQTREHVRKMPALSDYCQNDRDLFDLLKKLLVIDPLRRFSARQALHSASMFAPDRHLFSTLPAQNHRNSPAFSSPYVANRL